MEDLSICYRLRKERLCVQVLPIASLYFIVRDIHKSKGSGRRRSRKYYLSDPACLTFLFKGRAICTISVLYTPHAFLKSGIDRVHALTNMICLGPWRYVLSYLAAWRASSCRMKSPDEAISISTPNVVNCGCHWSVGLECQ